MIQGQSNPALDRAIERATPLCNELSPKLTGNTALVPLVIAAYCLRAYQHGIEKPGMPKIPRAVALSMIGSIADVLETVELPPARERN